MRGWRTVAAYTADREKKLTAESFFQIRYEDASGHGVVGKQQGEFHAGAAQGKRESVVVCDVGTRYVHRVSDAS